MTESTLYYKENVQILNSRQERAGLSILTHSHDVYKSLRPRRDREEKQLIIKRIKYTY